MPRASSTFSQTAPNSYEIAQKWLIFGLYRARFDVKRQTC